LQSRLERRLPLETNNKLVSKMLDVIILMSMPFARVDMRREASNWLREGPNI